MSNIRINRRFAALALGAALIIPLAACDAGALAGRTPIPAPTVAPVAVVAGSSIVPADFDVLEVSYPDRAERMGIERWCHADPSVLDSAERIVAQRHCRTLRGF